MKNKVVAGILAIIFAGLGIHSFYLGQPGKGIIYLLITGFSFFVGFIIPVFWIITFIVGLVSFITGIILLCESEDSFNLKYNKGYSMQQRPLASQQRWNNAASQPSVYQPKNTKTERNKTDMLMELKELLDKGILTQEEFEKEKQKILNS